MEFHGLEDLAAKPRSFLIGPHEPGSMCTKSSHMLLYVDVYGNQIRWCTTGPPIPLTCTKVTKVNLSMIEDMCIAQHKGKTLIVIADSFDGLFAFNAQNNREEWSFPANQLTTSTEKEDEEEDDEEEEMLATSITSDQQGYLFVCDNNYHCIHVFTTDGEYQGVAFKAGEPGLGKPKIVRWCKALSCLVIAHQGNDGTYSISIVKPS